MQDNVAAIAGKLTKARGIAARYMRFRAACEDRKGRPHVARSERYVAERTLAGLCDDGLTMRRLATRQHLLSEQSHG